MEGVESVSTGPEPLQNDRCKAILVLRLGAALNSIRAAQRWADKKEHEGPAGELDRFQAYLVAVAYLAEAFSLFWEHQDCILELARNGEAEESKIAELISIAAPESVQRKLLKSIRDQETFHWDSKIFREWATAQSGGIVWLRSSGDTAGECVVSASHAALVKFTADKGADNHESVDEQIVHVLEAMKCVIHVFQSAVNGFLLQHDAKHEIESGGPPSQAILP